MGQSGRAETFRSASEDETVAIAQRIASRLTRGSVIFLLGELGAGKTAFVRGLAKGLGIDPDEVSSPTFTIVQEYRGRMPLYHVDLYRLTTEEADDLGLDQLGDGDGVIAVEWAERCPPHLKATLVVRIEDGGGDVRVITVSGN